MNMLMAIGTTGGTASGLGWIECGGLWLTAFVMGAIPFGYLAGKMNGIDVRNAGSGNIGATNVFRTVGKAWGIGVFVLDFLKAYLPLTAIMSLADDKVLPLHHSAFILGAGVLSVLGHNYSPFLGFRGGKGMATSAGFLLAVIPGALGICLLGWILTFAITRYVSLASIVAGLLVPPAVLLLYPGDPWWIGASLVLALLSVWRHRSNIQRLREGTEHQFKRSAKDNSDHSNA